MMLLLFLFFHFFSYLSLLHSSQIRPEEQKRIELSFSPKSFYPENQNSRFLSLLKMKEAFLDRSKFHLYLNLEFNQTLQDAALYSYSKEKKNKIDVLRGKKELLVENLAFLLYSQSKDSSSVFDTLQQGCVSALLSKFANNPVVQNLSLAANQFVKNPEKLAGPMRQFFQGLSPDVLMCKIFFGGSIAVILGLLCKDVYCCQKINKNTLLAISILLAANCIIFYRKHFLYASQYIRFSLKNNEMYQSAKDYLLSEGAQKYFLYLCIVVECSFFLHKLYESKEQLYQLFLTIKNEKFFNNIKECISFLTTHKMKTLLFFPAIIALLFQEKIISFFFGIIKTIETNLVSSYQLSTEQKSVYDFAGVTIFSYIESVFYVENPKIVESDFDNLREKIKKEIEQKLQQLSKKETSDIQKYAEIEKIRELFDFAVINDVTHEQVKVYSFGRNFDRFILVQTALLMFKILFNYNMKDKFKDKNLDDFDNWCRSDFFIGEKKLKEVILFLKKNIIEYQKKNSMTDTDLTFFWKVIVPLINSLIPAESANFLSKIPFISRFF